MSNGKIFSGNQYYFVFKNKRIFEKNCAIVLFGKNFQYKINIETSQWTTLQIS